MSAAVCSHKSLPQQLSFKSSGFSLSQNIRFTRGCHTYTAHQPATVAASEQSAYIRVTSSCVVAVSNFPSLLALVCPSRHFLGMFHAREICSFPCLASTSASTICAGSCSSCEENQEFQITFWYCSMYNFYQHGGSTRVLKNLMNPSL